MCIEVCGGVLLREVKANMGVLLSITHRIILLYQTVKSLHQGAVPAQTMIYSLCRFYAQTCIPALNTLVCVSKSVLLRFLNEINSRYPSSFYSLSTQENIKKQSPTVSLVLVSL